MTTYNKESELKVDKSEMMRKHYDISLSAIENISQFTECVKTINKLGEEKLLPLTVVDETKKYITIEEEIMPFNFDDKICSYGKFDFENLLKTMIREIYRFNTYFNRKFNLKTTNILFDGNKNVYFTDNFSCMLDGYTNSNNPLAEIFDLLKEIKAKYFTRLKDNDKKILDLVISMENNENMILEDFILEVENAITEVKNQNESDSFFAELLAEYNDEYKEYLKDKKYLNILKDNARELYFSTIHKLENGKKNFVDEKVNNFVQNSSSNLVLRNYGIGNYGLEYALCYINNFRYIKGIDVTNNSISDVGFKYFCSCFKYIGLLENLIFSNNHITVNGLESFYENCCYINGLKKFSFSENDLHDEGGYKLIEIVKVLPVLSAMWIKDKYMFNIQSIKAQIKKNSLNKSLKVMT